MPEKNKIITISMNYDEACFEIDSFTDLKIQLTGRKTVGSDVEGPISLKTTLSLLHHLYDLVQQSAGIKNEIVICLL